MTNTIASRLSALGIVLPTPPAPIANFMPSRLVGEMLYLSGQGPLTEDGVLHQGKVGSEVSVEQAYWHARLTGLNLLAVAQASVGSLERVSLVVKLLGLVNAEPYFTEHPKVINGCSDLFVEVFGPQIGKGARSAVGMASLPGNQTVEIEAIFTIHPGG